MCVAPNALNRQWKTGKLPQVLRETNALEILFSVEWLNTRAGCNDAHLWVKWLGPPTLAVFT